MRCRAGADDLWGFGRRSAHLGIPSRGNRLRLRIIALDLFCANLDHQSLDINYRASLITTLPTVPVALTRKNGAGLDLMGLVGLYLEGNKSSYPAINTFSPSDGDGSAQTTWASAGATFKARFSQSEIHYGSTLMPNLPILIASDSRLQPQTFEGGIITSKEIDNLTLSVG